MVTLLLTLMFATKGVKPYEFEGTWDLNEVNLIDLEKLVREVGVKGDYTVWYPLARGELKESLRAIKTYGDVVRFMNDYKSEETVNFYLEHLSLEDLDNIYQDEEFFYSGEEPESETDPKYVAGEGEHSEHESVDGNESVDGVTLNDSDYDEQFDWTTVLPDQLINLTHIDALSGNVQALVAVNASRNPDATTLEDFDDEHGDSDYLESSCSYEDERGKKKFKLSDEITYKVGQIFTNAELVKTFVKEYGLQKRKDVWTKKNEKNKIVVKCQPKCPFHMMFSRSEPKTYFVLAKYNPNHKCYSTGKFRLIKTALLAKKLIPILKHSSGMKIKDLQSTCKDKWGVMLSHFKLYRVKKKAFELIHGGIDEQYAHLRNYVDELLRSNPGSIVRIKCAVGDAGPVFQRIYVCFNACKREFATTCRPLIGLDGCFLKGMYAGHLLPAIGKDGNNQMLPIAFAVVEIETKESWDWFRDLLLGDLNGIQAKKCSFISNQQKVCECNLFCKL